MSDEIPDLLYSDTERALSDALASLLADRGGLDKALARVESAQTYDDKLWQAVAADLGCAGLLIPERDGGAGASYREAAAAAEVLGSHLAPVPFLGSAVVATTALLSAGSGQDGLLAKMADGGVTAALAVRSPPCRDRLPGSVRVVYPKPAGDAGTGWRGCAGWSSGVADALPARSRRPGRRRAARVLP
jgi:alkylation response protein AidB-like acyl-CoA dehydrogenase